jgi:hypothetical protein
MDLNIKMLGPNASRDFPAFQSFLSEVNLPGIQIRSVEQPYIRGTMGSDDANELSINLGKYDHGTKLAGLADKLKTFYDIQTPAFVGVVEVIPKFQISFKTDRGSEVAIKVVSFDESESKEIVDRVIWFMSKK